MVKSNKGVYLARLSLTDVKSFKGRRVLNIRGDDGRLARWTLVLGENGTCQRL